MTIANFGDSERYTMIWIVVSAKTVQKGILALGTFLLLGDNGIAMSPLSAITLGLFAMPAVFDCAGTKALYESSGLERRA